MTREKPIQTKRGYFVPGLYHVIQADLDKTLAFMLPTNRPTVKEVEAFKQGHKAGAMALRAFLDKQGVLTDYDPRDSKNRSIF